MEENCMESFLMLFPQSDPTNANCTAVHVTAGTRWQNQRRISAAALSDVTPFQLVNTDVWKAVHSFETPVIA